MVEKRKKGDRVRWRYEDCDPENGPTGKLSLMEGTIDRIVRDGLYVVRVDDGTPEGWLHEVRDTWIDDDEDEFETWLKEVVRLAATKATKHGTLASLGFDSSDAIKEKRGDEPFDAWQGLDDGTKAGWKPLTPEDYVRELAEEIDLYGPEGE
jgi:hypothetical protein